MMTLISRSRRQDVPAILFLSLALLHCGCSGGRHPEACSFDAGGISVVNLYGSWYDMGRQYGTLAKDRIEDVLEYLDGKLVPGSERMASAMSSADSLYAAYPRHLKRFFKGVCRSSGISLERLKLSNAVEYVEGDFQCSALSVWGDFSAGKLIVGRNYDAASYSELSGDIIVTVYHPTGKIPAATVGYAGEIYCVNGLNAKGLFVELNNGMPSAGSKFHWEMTQSTVELFDALFNVSDLDGIDDFFNSTGSSSSTIIMVADRNESRSYEWCYDGMRRVDAQPEETFLASTNHYVDRSWPFPVPDDNGSWNSISRRCNLENLARSNRGNFDVERMKEVICTPLEDGGPSFDQYVRYRIVAVPEDMTLHLSIPDDGKWVELDMKDLF